MSIRDCLKVESELLLNCPLRDSLVYELSLFHRLTTTEGNSALTPKQCETQGNGCFFY